MSLYCIWTTAIVSFFFFKRNLMFIFQKERERERESRGGAERERERERERKTQNPKQAPGSELSAQSPMQC